LNLRFIYTGIRVQNMEESLNFYTKIFQMEIVVKLEKTEPTKGQVVTLKSKDSEQLLELNYYEENTRFGTEYKNGEELDHLAFDVEDLSGAVEELRKTRSRNSCRALFHWLWNWMEGSLRERSQRHMDRVARTKNVELKKLFREHLQSPAYSAI
jgi:Glyoxalase/Bleomycin resistance protein/Dioxygenase superfamily